MPLGMPEQVQGCLFDMDGVLTKTASVHAAAWKEMFDNFLRAHHPAAPPFDPVHDYDRYVDGRARADGTRAFLESRHISLPEGSADDAPGKETVQGLSNEKNRILLAKLAGGHVEVFDDTIRFLHAVVAAGLKRAVVSASANTVQVLQATGLDGMFDARIDGVVAEERHLRGKPAPDMFLAGAEALGLRPEQAAVFEDALAGVEAGRAGGFAFVVGVDRVGQGQALQEHGADVVVTDVSSLLGDK